MCKFPENKFLFPNRCDKDNRINFRWRKLVIVALANTIFLLLLFLRFPVFTHTKLKTHCHAHCQSWTFFFFILIFLPLIYLISFGKNSLIKFQVENYDFLWNFNNFQDSNVRKLNYHKNMSRNIEPPHFTLLSIQKRRTWSRFTITRLQKF